MERRDLIAVVERWMELWRGSDPATFDALHDAAFVDHDSAGRPGDREGAFLGHAPTGARVRFRGIEIVRVREGRIVERWGEWDGLDLSAQLRAAAAEGSERPPR